MDKDTSEVTYPYPDSDSEFFPSGKKVTGNRIPVISLPFVPVWVHQTRSLGEYHPGYDIRL